LRVGEIRIGISIQVVFFRAQGLRFGVQGLGFRVKGLGCRSWGWGRGSGFELRVRGWIEDLLSSL